MRPEIWGVIALALLALLITSRVIMMKMGGVKAFVFANDDKTDLLLAPFVLFIAYQACAGAFGWPMPQAPFFTYTLLDAAWLRWAGVGLCALALVGVAASIKSFGDSLRVGIDRDKPGALITSGVFAVSRNPLYVCFAMIFLGLLLLHPTFLMLMCYVGLAAIIHRQVLREEDFLKAHYGAPYADYCRRVRRYL